MSSLLSCPASEIDRDGYTVLIGVYDTLALSAILASLDAALAAATRPSAATRGPCTPRATC